MKKQLLLVCAIALFSMSVNAQRWDDTSGDGLWETATNWTTDAVPVDDGSTVEFVGGTAATNCTLSTAVSITKMRIGLGGVSYGSLIIEDGGSLTMTDGWSGVGHNAEGTLDVKAGGVVTFPSHMWIAFDPDGVGHVSIAGLIEVQGMFGFNFEGLNETGSGDLTIQDGGKLYLHQWHGGGQSMNGMGLITISSNGTMQIIGEKAGALADHITANQIVAADGGAIVVTEANGYTYVTNDARWDGTDPLSVEDESILGFEVYPNPTSNMINVNSQTKISSMKLYNVLGQKVLENEGKSSMDISKLNAGFYIINAEDEEGNVGVKRIVKQ